VPKVRFIHRALYVIPDVQREGVFKLGYNYTGSNKLNSPAACWCGSGPPWETPTNAHCLRCACLSLSNDRDLYKPAWYSANTATRPWSPRVMSKITHSKVRQQYKGGRKSFGASSLGVISGQWHFRRSPARSIGQIRCSNLYSRL
jgi:hypothetical protein